MTALAGAVLPLIRTRSDLHRWSAANAHGQQMHEAVDLLEAAVPTSEPAELYSVTHRALGSAVTVISRADDSSGIIGDACRRLLELHPKAAAAARTPVGPLIDWMMKFQFGDGAAGYFELDPVAYAPALGERGLETYRKRLAGVDVGLGARPDGRWSSEHSHVWFALDWNAQRLAILDRDIDAIIRTHAKDRRVAAWLEDTAKALEEIGEIDLAIDWARQAVDFDHGHQSLTAAEHWCTLLADHRPSEALQARLTVFRKWPSSTSAAHLYGAAATSWPEFRDEVVTTLSASPGDAVLFAVLTLKDPSFAWALAHSLDLDDDRTWSELAKVYEKVDPLAVLPVHQRLVENELVDAGVQHYRRAARRLATMRRLAIGTTAEDDVDALIVQLRETHRRRPRLQQEFGRAGLP